MDAKEALRYFHFVVTLGRAYYPNSEDFKAHELAVEAFKKVETLEAENARLREKETPKEPIYVKEGDAYCPICGDSVNAWLGDEFISDEFISYKFCSNCGQAIKNDKE